MGGTRAVSIDNGRQPLDMSPQHFSHGLLFSLAQLGELLGDV